MLCYVMFYVCVIVQELGVGFAVTSLRESCALALDCDICFAWSRGGMFQRCFVEYSGLFLPLSRRLWCFCSGFSDLAALAMHTSQV